jgi:methyl coenzyme M reductase beta subunit
MQWTILWFQNRTNLWDERSQREEEDFPSGHKFYAIKQKKLWNAFKSKALERFGLYLPSSLN